MNNDVIISVEHLSKRYKLGQIGATTLRESVERFWHRLRGRDPEEHMGEIGKKTKTVEGRKSQVEREEAPAGSLPPSTLDVPPSTSAAADDLWALRDVSFEVKRGEVLGIIGRNGAGKSTLLKILSRITEPTSGRAVLRGRLASLLEVGTGFHPDLTGRENIYLNGAILGMKKKEIAAKFDEIVAFSEVERFIDTPVKRYSSGMYVRLAFAVAAHLEPEILLVDEVLAVGDALFQKKCLGKMDEVAKEGRTILFVSHNMAAMKTLCSRAILLQNGDIQLDGTSENTISHYLNVGAASQYVAPASRLGTPHITRLFFADMAGAAKARFRNGEPVVLNVEMENPRAEALELAFAFFDNGGYKLWNFTHEQYNLPPITACPKARVSIAFFVPVLSLHEIFVHVGLHIKRNHVNHYVDHITEGLHYTIEEPVGDTYQRADTIMKCPVEFRVLSNE